MIVTCDPGVDDLLALLVLTGAGVVPELIVATGGNVDVTTATQNAAGIMAALGLSVPVLRGPDQSVGGPLPKAGGLPFHGSDGLGGVAGELPLANSNDSARWDTDGSLVGGEVLVTGPLTVAALAGRSGTQFDRITWMGGSVYEGGNITPSAEFNAWLDPDAAEEVFAGTAMVNMVPLDVTHRVPLQVREVSGLASLGEFGGLAARACRELLERDGLVHPHDAVAVTALLHPEWFRWEQLPLRCETADRLTRGATVVDRRPSTDRRQVSVAVDLDVLAVQTFIFESLASLP